MDLYLVEAVINGLLLGGVLALLALGLNLIFGVVDVVWIAYADLVMCGMYAVYWLYADFGWPLPLAFGVALVGAIALYVFLKRTFIGTAIRAISQDRDVMGLMGVDQRRIYLVTSAIGGALAGLGACLLALQYDVHPFIGNTFGPLVFMICVLGGLGNMIGGFIAAFIISQIIAIGGYYFSTELSYVLAFMLFIVLMFVRPQGIVGR